MSVPLFSRKFLAATGTAAIMSICWALCQWLPGAREYFSTLITGLVGIFTTYSAANVAQDHVMSKAHREEHVEATTVTRTVSNTPASTAPGTGQSAQAEPVTE